MMKCPVLNKTVEDIICFDIQMVSEGLAPERTAPKEAILVKNFRDICLECPNHDK